MKKLLSVLLSTIVACSILTGCGSSKTDTISSGEKGTQTEKKQETQERQQNLTVMIIGGEDETTGQNFQRLVEKFNAENKFNVNIDLQAYENEQFKTRLTTLMAANTPPDIFFTWEAGFLKPFVDGGKVYEIGQELDKDDEWKGRFNEGVFGPVTYGDKVYAVPHAQAVTTVFYNTRLFKEQGVEIPKTMEEFKVISQKFLDTGVVPMAFAAKDSWIAGQFLQQVVNGVGGMDLYNQTVAGTKMWDDELYIKGGEVLKELADMKIFPEWTLGMTYDEARSLFMNEKAAMYYMGSWDLFPLTNETVPVSKNIGVFTMPAVDVTNENILVGSIDQSFAISAKCKNIEAATAFIKMLSGKESQESFAYDAKLLISTKTALDETKLSPLYVEINKIQQSSKGLTPWFDRVFGAGEGTEFNNAAQSIIAGKNPAEQMKDLQQFAVDNSTR